MNLSSIVVSAFHAFWKEARDGHRLHHVLKGGRNSGKSSAIAQRLICDLIDQPINALVIRKVGNTLKDSVYEQLKEAIIQLGVEAYFHAGKSPMEITYKPRGNKILFRGADDPAKIKSIKSSKYPIARGWFEELAEFKTYEEIQTIVNSILRAELPGALSYKIYYSYNPPKRKMSWVNKRYNTVFIPKNTFVHHSTYLDNPHVSKQMIEEAEDLKANKEQKYRWIYLGEAIGGGIVPFDNLEFRAITDDELKRFDNIKEGIDWGYGVDPFAWVQMHYDRTRRKLYIFDEVYGVKLSNRVAFSRIKPKTKSTSIADSAEPKSIDDMRSYGLRIKGAKKGPGSVEHGEKWLDDLEAIIIDPKRCPNTAREFENIDYKVDRFGDLISKLEDKDNHTIDATRYALESEMTKSGFGWPGRRK